MWWSQFESGSRFETVTTYYLSKHTMNLIIVLYYLHTNPILLQQQIRQITIRNNFAVFCVLCTTHYLTCNRKTNHVDKIFHTRNLSYRELNGKPFTCVITCKPGKTQTIHPDLKIHRSEKFKFETEGTSDRTNGPRSNKNFQKKFVLNPGTDLSQIHASNTRALLWYWCKWFKFHPSQMHRYIADIASILNSPQFLP